METFTKIIDAFGGPARFAEAMGITASHAGVMKARQSVPSEYWSRLVSEASHRGIQGITHESLAELAASKRANREEAQPAPAPSHEAAE
jgi:hypothetical protein